MGALRKLVAALSCGLSLIGFSPAEAMPNQVQQTLTAKVVAPGQPGFVNVPSTKFQLTNWLFSTNSFGNTGTTGWNPASVGSQGAPTFPNGQKTDTAPDGTTTATDLNIPAVAAGSTNYSILYATTNSSAGFVPFDSWTFQMWVKDLDGPSNGNAYLSILSTSAIGTAPLTHANNLTNNTSTGAAFQAVYGTQYQYGFSSKAIPNDGNWHLVAVWVPAQFIHSGIHQYIVSIGNDRRDTGNQGTVPTATKHIAIWHAGFFKNYSEGGNGWGGDVQNDTTGAPTAVNVTLALPKGVAFRDFTPLRAWIWPGAPGGTSPGYLNGITQITIQNTSEAYQYGGVGNPFWGTSAAYQVTGTYAGQRCGFTSTTDGTNVNTPTPNHDDWFNTVLYCGSDMFHTKEAQPGSPQIQIPSASVIAAGGLSPCPSACGATLTVSGATYNAANGQVTLTLSATPSQSIPPPLDVLVQSVAGTGTATVNGTFPIVSIGTNSLVYQTPFVASQTFTYTSGGTAAETATMDSYVLHAWWLPPNSATGAECNIGGTNYIYCALLSAKNGTNGTGGHTMFIAYSQTIDSGYCMYDLLATSSGTTIQCANGAATTPGGANTNLPSGVVSNILYGGSADTNIKAPSLPALIQGNGLGGSGTINYLITPDAGGDGGFVLWADTPGDGLNWTYVADITGPGSGGPDWDATSSRIDPAIYLNKCPTPFLELYYTTFATNAFQGLTGSAKSQAIGYFVATDIRGPYYHFNGPGPARQGLSPSTTPTGGVIPFDSNIFNGKQFVGESNVWDDHGLLFWTGNTDDGHVFSSGVSGYMKDACQMSLMMLAFGWRRRRWSLKAANDNAPDPMRARLAA